MSNIIECPACATRYKMNKAIPEGGRSVKCARCGNQWRLEPEEPVEELMELDEGEDHEVAAAAQHAQASPSGHSPMEEFESSNEFFHGAVGNAQWDDEDRADDEDHAVENRHDLRHSAYEETEDSGFTHMRHWQDENESGEAETDDYALNNDRHQSGFETRADTGFYGSRAQDIFNMDQSRGDLASTEMDDEPEENQHWSPQSLSQSLAKDPLFDDSGVDEDAEMAVRSVLKGALANPREVDDSEAAFENEESGQSDEDAAWQHFASQTSEDQREGKFEAHGQSSAEDEEFNASMGAIASDHRFYEDPDAGYQAEFDEDNFEETHGNRHHARSGYDLNDPAFEDEIEDAFRSGAVPHSAAERISGDLRPDDIDQEDMEYPRRRSPQPELSEDELDANYFDDDAASLQSQFEEGSLTNIERQHSSGGGGGLAIAAAWAVFFSIISGVALALVSFRTEIVTALPGMGALYQTVGFNVAPSNVDFSNVSYRWTVDEGKPMIEVTGKLVNLTDQQIPVPKVLVNVRNSENNNDSQTTATVRTEPLAPREVADFTLEFVAPPTTISQIELELDKSQ